jgi:hypothetical protein
MFITLWLGSFSGAGNSGAVVRGIWQGKIDVAIKTASTITSQKELRREVGPSTTTPHVLIAPLNHWRILFGRLSGEYIINCVLNYTISVDKITV